MLTECQAVIQEWDADKNPEMDAHKLTYGSSKEVWWRCDKGHSYKCRIVHRTVDGVGCPYCANRKLLVGYNDLLTVNPELCLDWDYDANYPKTPQDFIVGSSKTAHWLCHTCGHKWSTTIDSRCQGKNCPKCAQLQRIKTYKQKKIQQNGSLQDNNPDLASQWNFNKNGDLTPEDVTSQSIIKVWWVCEKGHEWQATINNRAKGKGCPYCNGERRTSIPEQIIFYYLSMLFDAKNRCSIDKHEIDVYIPDLQIGIEYDGIYWHNSENKNRIDDEKDKYLRTKNIKLIRVKESDLYSKSDDIIMYQYSYDYHTMKQVVLDILDIISSITNVQYSIDIDISRDMPSIIQLLNLKNKENSLLFKRPEIIEYWDSDRNTISPEQISYGSQKHIYLRCNNGHIWTDTPNNFYRHPFCAYCNGTNLRGKRFKHNTK